MKIEESTDIIARILHSWGIRYVIASSGSRSLRMVRAAVDNKSLDVRMIVDERVAGFSSLGISDCTGEPTALICTSGSAMLNYSPAISEAYYRGIPIIVITADRPADIIDINDGQTIHQFHALDNIVKTSIDIDATKACRKEDFEAISKAISIALSPRKGPVHINLHLEEGNDALTFKSIDYDVPSVAVPVLNGERQFPSSEAIAHKKVLVFLGQMPYDREVATLIRKVSSFPNIAVVTDIISNCSEGNAITDIESIIGKVREKQELYAPDVVITMGKTSPISRRFKEWLRSLGNYSHWRVNDRPEPEDTYSHLDRTIVADDKTFLKYLADNMPSDCKMKYNRTWIYLSERAQRIKRVLLSQAAWSDISAINMIAEHLPENYNIQCSNGMSIRYLSLIGVSSRRTYSNRGVNGIDGSTSTALGFSSVSESPTLLVTGDMSALYDISALYSGQLSSKFKMIVIANNGGEIFRMTKATRDYENRENMLCKMPEIKWDSVAQSVGMEYFEASDKESLRQIISCFFEIRSQASMLVINTPAGNSCIYNDIIKEIHNKL